MFIIKESQDVSLSSIDSAGHLLILLGSFLYPLSFLLPAVLYENGWSFGYKCFYYSLMAPLDFRELAVMDGHVIAAQWGRIANILILSLFVFELNICNITLKLFYCLVFATCLFMLIFAPFSKHHTLGSVVHIEAYGYGYFVWTISMLLIFIGNAFKFFTPVSAH